MSDERRRAILETASRDPELVAQIAPVVAAGFGVLPLRRLGDVLTVACFPRSNRKALRLLRDVLEVEIVATPFEDSILHEAIRRAYFPNDETVNFPTFLDPDFLEDSASAPILREEKVEVLGPCSADLPEDQVVLAQLSYHSILANSDARDVGQALPDPDRTRLDLGSLESGWRMEQDLPEVFVPGGELPKDTRAIVTQFRLTDYRHMHAGVQVSEHHVNTCVVQEPPLVIHPTEVQLTRIGADGGLGFHVYDHDEAFGANQPGRITVDYHFLSYGNRMRRQIRIQLHEVLVVPRVRLEVSEGEVPWGATELARWFGLDDPEP